jgi:hypothetical protein
VSISLSTPTHTTRSGTLVTVVEAARGSAVCSFGGLHPATAISDAAPAIQSRRWSPILVFDWFE